MEATPAKKMTRAEKIAAGIPKPLQKMQRKKAMAEGLKAARKTQYYASLRDYPSSPRKMRLVADQIRGVNVDRALGILKLSPKHASEPLRRLLLAAIDSFEQKSGQRADTPGLYVQTITVDGAGMLKRLRPAPQGRGYRVRKRSNHVTLFLNVRGQEGQVAAAPVAAAEPTPAAEGKKAKAPKVEKAEKAATEKKTAKAGASNSKKTSNA